MSENEVHELWNAMYECEADINKLKHYIGKCRISESERSKLADFAEMMSATIKDLQAEAIKLEG